MPGNDWTRCPEAPVVKWGRAACGRVYASIDIAAFLRDEPIHSYSNDFNELVTWPFVGVLDIQNLENPKNASEIAGFITGCMEFQKWAQKSDPRLHTA
jgi:hypothetical protein